LYDLTALHELRDEELANAVYKTIFVENSRTSKHTEVQRFRDADDTLLDLLPRTVRHVVHDVAVSSGVTSLELLETLEHGGIAADFYISDKYSTLYARGRRFRRIYDSNLNIMKFQVFNILADKTATRAFPVSIALYHLLSSLQGPAPRPGDTLQEIKLFHPAVLRALSAGAVRELYYDVFETDVELRFTCVRAMNILNLRCFRPERLRVAIRNLGRSLAEGGILEIGRTVETGRNDASFYAKRRGVLVHLEDLNEGSELKDLIAAEASG
jgi:hypothetical protein